MVHRALGAGFVLLLGGCAATPPPPPGPTMEEFRALSATADSLGKEKAALEARVAAIEKTLEEVRRTGEKSAWELNRIDTELKRQDAAQNNLDAMLGALKEPAPKGPDELPHGAGAPLKGQVLAADAQMGIYLVSVGRKDGLKIADELTVFRGDRFVAQVVVDKVFEDKASVVVKTINEKPMLKLEIKTGDKVARVL